jgi:superfamily I DNA/RNA helicase
VQARVDQVLAGLDGRQRAAATLGPGPAQVIAPAGSGKTATLVARIGVLIVAGVRPASILVVTFNRDAASELSRDADSLRCHAARAVVQNSHM